MSVVPTLSTISKKMSNHLVQIIWICHLVCSANCSLVIYGLNAVSTHYNVTIILWRNAEYLINECIALKEVKVKYTKSKT